MVKILGESSLNPRADGNTQSVGVAGAFAGDIRKGKAAMSWLKTLGIVGLLSVSVTVASQERATAADWPGTPYLRGSLRPLLGYARWDGFFVGGDIGYSNLNVDFGNSTSDQVAYILRNTTIENEFSPSTWTTLPKSVTNSVMYGGFVGYNLQFEQIVLGIDVGYHRPTSMQTAVSDSLERQFVTSDGYNNDVRVDAQASLTLVDYGTVRGRVGYAFGRFLPYVLFGGAVGRFDYAHSATVTAFGYDTVGAGLPYTLVQTESDSKGGAFSPGVVAGLGLDVSVTPNVFLRAEWEYVDFAEVGNISSFINTGRVGIAVRF
jgi:outer membrane immunogenic protein